LTIGELFEQSTNHVDLQALIMFLVLEKQVLSMDDDQKELELYFLPKHKERMNKELIDYKRKMKMKYGPSVFEVSDDRKVYYVLAFTERQARFIANNNLIKVNEIKTCDLDQPMTLNGIDTTFRMMIKDKKPCILGGH